MRSTAYRLLLAILFAAPLAFGAVQPWAWAALGMVAVLLLAWWAVASVRQGMVRIVWPPLYVPLLAMLALGAAQLFGHSTLDAIATREALLKLSIALIFFFLAAQFFSPASPKSSRHRVTETQSDPWRQPKADSSLRCASLGMTCHPDPAGAGEGSAFSSGSDRAMRVLGLAVTVYALALAVFAIVQFFSSPGLIYWTVKPRWGGWVFGPYVNHNHYAGLMEMLIPLAAVYVFSRPPRHPARLLLGFAVCVAVASVLLSGSRGGLIALGAEVLILAAILVRRVPGGGFCRGRACPTLSWMQPSAAGYGKPYPYLGIPGRRLAAAGALGMVVAVSLFLWMDRGDILKRFSDTASLTCTPEATFGERRLVALDTLRMFRHRPITGAGLGSFETAYPPYRSFPSDFEWDHAHNDYAEALAETGLVGLALILVSLVLFLGLAFSNLGERLRHESGWMQLGAALGCSGLLVHSLVDFNLHIPANAAWFAFCAGLASSAPAGHPASAVVQHQDTKSPR
jgi:O-antigen ligase